MKKTLIFIMLFIVLLSNVGFCNNSVKVLYNDKEITCDVQPFIENGRTLIPVRMAEQLGYKVTWNESSRTVFLSKDNTNIILTIGNDVAVVNGKEVKLDVPAEITQSRTFVPVRFVAENFGYLVKWDANTMSVLINDSTGMIVTAVKTSKTASAVNVQIVTSGGTPTVQTMVLDNPKRYVYDVQNALLSDGVKTENITSNAVSSVRFSQFSYSPNVVRVVVELKADTTVNAGISNGIYTVAVTETAAVVTPPAQNTSKDDFLIVIDPGHGGEEPGSLGKINGEIVLYEKDVNLKIGKKVYEKLLARGYNVIATRTTDATVSLAQRVEIANTAGADLFVSVHNNSFSDSSAKGTLTMYAFDDPKTVGAFTGKQVASIIQPYLAQATQSQDRQLMHNPKIYVTARTTMPAVLCECLFMSNPDDLAKLMDDNWVERIAEGISKGIEAAVAQMK